MFLVHHVRQAVGRQQEGIACLYLAVVEIGGRVSFGAKSPRDDIRLRMVLGLFRRDHAPVHLFLDPGVIAGHLADHAIPNEVGSTVPDVADDVTAILAEEQDRRRGTHPELGRVFGRLAEDLPTRLHERRAEPILDLVEFHGHAGPAQPFGDPLRRDRARDFSRSVPAHAVGYDEHTGFRGTVDRVLVAAPHTPYIGQGGALPPETSH